MKLITRLNRFPKIYPFFSKLPNKCKFQESPRSSEPNQYQTQYQKENENNKSCNISFPHAIVYPGTMVIILFHANFADLAMITSFRFFLNTFKTYLLSLVYIQSNILLLFDFRSNKQCRIKYHHHSNNNTLNSIEVVVFIDKQAMKYE